MFEVSFNNRGEVELAGRLDAAQAARAQEFLDALAGPCVLDMTTLDYISSAGLGVLLKTHKRMLADSSGMSLINVNPHIIDIFRFSGFDNLFDIKVLGA